MVDYLGVLERASKQRLGHGRVRRHALAAGRKQGQGSPNGVFITSNLGYVQRVVRKGKGPQRAACSTTSPPSTSWCRGCRRSCSPRRAPGSRPRTWSPARLKQCSATCADVGL